MSPAATTTPARIHRKVPVPTQEMTSTASVSTPITSRGKPIKERSHHPEWPRKVPGYSRHGRGQPCRHGCCLRPVEIKVGHHCLGVHACARTVTRFVFGAMGRALAQWSGLTTNRAR
jgi:hypothetical protein